jgi:GNAT superfamily N-acetyltransferase
MARQFSVGALDAQCDKSGFSCGIAPLDNYFRTQAGQDIRRRVAACFVARDAAGKVVGFYTLAAASLLLNELPDAQAKKLPRYPSVPAVRMGRLAVDQAFKGQGLGAALLADALGRAARAEIAAYALVVDAKDAQAADFYAHHGFIALPDQPLFLFMPLSSVKDLVK